MGLHLLPGMFAILSSVALWLLFVFGRAGYRRRPGTCGSSSTPRVAVIIPATGVIPDLDRFLSQVTRQSYPEFRIYFVTRDDSDPAARIIGRFAAGRGNCFLVFSGQATACSQKNINLLAGIRAAGDWPEVLAFCDTGHEVPPHWLTELVRGLQTDHDGSSTGYHLVLPQDRRIPTVGKAICVIALYLLQGIDAFRQVWGGSNAIRRATFRQLEVDRLWGQAVVDDVSLTKLLKESARKIAMAPGAVLTSREGRIQWRNWSAWLTRQWIFLKFWFPAEWAILGVLGHVLIFCLVFCALQILAVVLGRVSIQDAVWAAVGLGSYLVLAETIRRSFHPGISLLRWMAATAAALGMAGWCHIRTTFSMKVRWEGIEYRVSAAGRVKHVRRL